MPAHATSSTHQFITHALTPLLLRSILFIFFFFFCCHFSRYLWCTFTFNASIYWYDYAYDERMNDGQMWSVCNCHYYFNLFFSSVSSASFTASLASLRSKIHFCAAVKCVRRAYHIHLLLFIVVVFLLLSTKKLSFIFEEYRTAIIRINVTGAHYINHQCT